MNPSLKVRKRFLYVFTAAPYSNAIGQEGLDAVLVGAAFDLQVSVLFIHDGVFQIKAGQNTDNTELKQFTKTFRALQDFEVEQQYVLDSSLAARGLGVEQLTVPVEILDQQAVSRLIRQQHRVFTF